MNTTTTMTTNSKKFRIVTDMTTRYYSTEERARKAFDKVPCVDYSLLQERIGDDWKVFKTLEDTRS